MDEVRQKIQASDWRLVAVVTTLLAASAFYVGSNYEAAFPQASLDLPLRQDEIIAAAAAFLGQRGLNPAGFRNLTTFEPDDEARLYLERELGLDQANRLMRAEAPVWRWRARWFRPPEKEERIVHLRTNGQLVAFEHRVPETDRGARLDPVSARNIAEAFLKGQTRLPHKLVGEQSEKRPNRDDHVFTWEQENFRAKEATLRRTVVVYGDRVGRYREYLHIPEQWQRDFSRLRSSNELYAAIAQGLYMILAVAALVFLVLHLRHGSIQWRPLLAISAVVAIFHLFNELNTLPFTIDAMPTSSSYSEMVTLALLQAVGAATGIFLYVMGPAAAGAPLYARWQQRHVPLTEAFSMRGLATRSYFRAVIAGFGLAAGHMAFLTAFYLLGAKVGVWSPQEVNYSDVLATPMPWVYPVSIALMASAAEEFWFRLLAIPLLGRFLRQKWLVIAIPAFVWGFLHANYPQQPGYIRGVEVGIIGVAAGYLMLRFGIVATLVWHYVIDAFLIGMFLFRAENWVYRLNGFAVGLAIVAPLLLSLILYRRNRGFLVEVRAAPEPETQQPAAGPEPVPASRPEPPPGPLLPDRVLWIAAALFAITALAGRPVEFGDFIRLKTPRSQAEEIARREMQARGMDPAQWRLVSDFSVNLGRAEAEYLRQQLGARLANLAIEEHRDSAVWRVRFFRPLEREEWIFFIDQNGRIYRYDHELDEKAPGASLQPDEARRLAERYLSSRQAIPIETYRLVDSQEERRERRTDHSFVWEHPSFRAGEARLRVSLLVVGDETCQFRRFFKLPEQWLREFQKPRLQSFLLPAYLGALGMSLLVVFVRRLGAPDQRFHWRIYGWIAAAGLVAVLVARANEWPAYLLSYDTSTTLENFYGQLLASRLSLTLLAGGGFLLCALAADALLQRIFGNRRLPAPSLSRAAAVAALIIASSLTLDWIRQMTPGMRLDPSLFYLGGLDSAFPAIALLEGALLVSFFGVALAAMFLAGLVARLTKRGLLTMALVILVLLSVSRTIELRQLPGEVLAALVTLTVVALIAGNAVSDLASVWTGLFWAMAAEQSWRMMSQPDPFLKANGVAAAAVAIVLGVVVVRWMGRWLRLGAVIR